MLFSGRQRRHLTLSRDRPLRPLTGMGLSVRSRPAPSLLRTRDVSFRARDIYSKNNCCARAQPLSYAHGHAAYQRNSQLDPQLDPPDRQHFASARSLCSDRVASSGWKFDRAHSLGLPTPVGACRSPAAPGLTAARRRSGGVGKMRQGMGTRNPCSPPGGHNSRT